MPLFCRYQDFVEQHEDREPQGEHGRIKDHCGLWAVHLWMAPKTGKKTRVLCMPLFYTPLGIPHL